MKNPANCLQFAENLRRDGTMDLDVRAQIWVQNPAPANKGLKREVSGSFSDGHTKVFEGVRKGASNRRKYAELGQPLAGDRAGHPE